jgi:hypothetical protein
MIRALVMVLATALAATGLAAASNGTQRVVVESFTEQYAFDIDCDEFGGFDFVNEVEGTVKVRVTDVLDSDGTLMQTVIEEVYEETDTNSLSGESLPLRGAAHVVLDYAANTRTLTGAVLVGMARGEGTYIQDSGRIVMTLETSEPLFVAGPHEGFFAGVDNLVCAALADG